MTNALCVYTQDYYSIKHFPLMFYYNIYRHRWLFISLWFIKLNCHISMIRCLYIINEYLIETKLLSFLLIFPFGLNVGSQVYTGIGGVKHNNWRYGCNNQTSTLTGTYNNQTNPIVTYLQDIIQMEMSVLFFVATTRLLRRWLYKRILINTFIISDVIFNNKLWF